MSSAEIKRDLPDAWDHIHALGADEIAQAFNAVYARLGINKLYPGTDTVAPNQRQQDAADATVSELMEKGLI